MLVYVVLRAAPFLGRLLGIAATIVGLIAMWLLYREKRGAAKPEPAEA